jgi:hypothetical protein
MKSIAERIADMIRRNVDLWYADVISHERFSARSATLWSLARQRRVDDAVMEIVRPPMVVLTPKAVS